MQLIFSVNEQIITFDNPEKKVVANSKNYLDCVFKFSEDWNGTIKTAIFISAKGDIFNVILENDACSIPYEVIEYPHFSVSVFGGDLITANKVVIPVSKSGYEKGKTPSNPTPDVYEQILKAIKGPYIGENGNWYVWDIENEKYVDSGVSSTNSDSNLKYYGTSDVEITPAYRVDEVIPDDVEMCLLYEIDEETQTASIIGYHSQKYRKWEIEYEVDGSLEYDYGDEHDGREEKYYSIVVPYEINGCPVTKINDSAFYKWFSGYGDDAEYSEELGAWVDFCNYHSIESVLLPNTITYIGDSAFAYCEGLYFINLPESITDIGSYCFECCYALEEITIPSTVVSFGEHIFASINLYKLTLAQGLKVIPKRLFDGQYLITQVIIPNSVTTIEDEAFYNSFIEQITIPNSVTTIGERAFYNCGLKDVTISKTVTKIGAEAFIGNNALSVTFLNKQQILYDEAGDPIINYEFEYDDTAFSEKTVFFVAYDSVISYWCEEKGFSVNYTDIPPDFTPWYSENAFHADYSDYAYHDGEGNDIAATFRDIQQLLSKAVKPQYITNASYMFSEGANGDLLRTLNTEYIEVANSTFKKSPNEDISFDAINCESMQHCFESSSAVTVTFPNGTPKLTLANNIFSKCAALASVSGLDCSSVTTLKYAFNGCTSLEIVDLLSTANVKDFSYAFYGAGLKTITGLDTLSAEHLDGAFAKSTIEALALDCTNVISATGLFTNCLSLSVLALKNLNDSGVALEIFNSLPTTEAGTITLENCTISDDIKAIATEKGWLINEQ